MSSEFLKKAREGNPCMGKYRDGRPSLAQGCWSEILAVVEAAEALEYGDHPVALNEALDVLDKKAEEH